MPQWTANHNDPTTATTSRLFSYSSSTVLVAARHSSTSDARKQQYMYLTDPQDISPLKEYKSRVPPRDDGVEIPDRPDFLYNPSYPYPRLVEFYAPWCPHCQHFKDTYIQFAKTMDFVAGSLSPPVSFESHAQGRPRTRPVSKYQY